MKKIKVAGYVQKVNYGNGIEYRNFSDDLVGNQISATSENAIFTMGNFSVVVNNEPRVVRNINTAALSDYIGLNDLNLLNDSTSHKLNLDSSNTDYFALFGSLSELIRVSLTNIFEKWPAAITLSPNSDSDSSRYSPTISQYDYDNVLDVTTLVINVNSITNLFNINIKNELTEDERNLFVNFANYVIVYDGNEFPILDFINTNDSLITFKLRGELDPLDTYVNLTVKPNAGKVEEFFSNLTDFEAIL